MKDFEILNRASGFLVRSLGGGGVAGVSNGFAPHPAPKVHLLTASHVVAPWRWPKYYPEEWLQHVNEKHTAYTAEKRHDDGVFATQCDLKPISYHHDTRDLAVLHFENEDEVLELLDSVGVDVLELAPSQSPRLKEGEKLEFHGHHIGGNDIASASEDDDLRKSIPKVSSGVVKGRTERQIFAQTSPVLTQGMCGGPVIGAGGGECFGLVEGIVPPDHAIDTLQSLAVFVESPEIREFLEAIEAGRVQPYIGGHSIKAVNADQNPEKLDLHRIINADSGGPKSNAEEPKSNFTRKQP